MATVTQPATRDYLKREQRMSDHYIQFLAAQASDIIDQVVQLYAETQTVSKVSTTDTRCIAVDFDGTLHQQGDFTDPAEIDGPPVPGAFAFLSLLRGAGYRVVIFTARMSDQPDEVKLALIAWFNDHGFDPADLEFTAVKPHALMYLDDRAVRFNGVFPTLQEIKELSIPWNRSTP